MKHIGESCKDASDGVIERLRVVTENDIEDFLRILVEGFDVVIFSISFREGHMNRAHVGVCAADRLNVAGLSTEKRIAYRVYTELISD